ncbi:uncharacterized protein LOC133710324 isoform X1 [Rosa rugosa]|uniref:uncharacterized protein LOC133710324 isoform X1 n=2 Tax=Rosa rugosa TaxID=74645 RepID=UPI002B410903|nr:uncharacterized protein LOC133710324 isoform X1 [Rosa rugosa]
MNKPTYNLIFSKDHIYKDLNKVWKEEVEPVFASHGLTCRMNEVKPILLQQIYCDVIKIEKPDGMSEEEFSSNYDDFIDKFENLYELQRQWYCFVIYFDECITVLATSFQATSAVKCLVQESLFGTIPFQDNAEMLIRCIETYDKEEETLTNNLELFCSLLAGVTE